MDTQTTMEHTAPAEPTLTSETTANPETVSSSSAAAAQPETAESVKPAPSPRRQRLQRAQQRRRLHNVILAGVFLLILLVFFIINLAVKDRDFSDAENRNLTQKPAFSLTTLADGSYFSALSDYTSDQFFGRQMDVP